MTKLKGILLTQGMHGMISQVEGLAKAMEIENESGSITKGKLASLIVTEDISSYNFIPYSFGENNIERVMIKGKWI